MATYAVGDLQGCYAEFCDLLSDVGFDAARDRLWLLGDLVNRGPQSLEVVRLVRSFGDAVSLVLGNHDLHFLAIHLGGHNPVRSDTFHDLLTAAEADDIAEWLCAQPLLVRDDALGYAMTHAGIPHIWNLEEAAARATEVEAVIRGRERVRYFERMYGNEPDRWSEKLDGMDRWRVITNYFTRMRLVDRAGRMNFSHKGSLAEAPEGWQPWFTLRAWRPLQHKLLFGHWAALQGGTGDPDVIALDTGCVWGGALTALCLESGRKHAVPARARRRD